MLAGEEKLNPEADPNPEAAAGFGVKEKFEAEGAEPNPEGGCVGAAKMLLKPVEEDCVAAEPNPLAWMGAGAPQSA